jgi:AcrR family transcriptional regulator
VGEQRTTGEGLPRLPPGRHGLPREFVKKNQRDRIAAGMIQAVARDGFRETTVTSVAAFAGLSRRTFYTFYSSKEDCFFATYEVVGDFIFEAMDEAGGEIRGWSAKVRARLSALLETFAANTDLAYFVLIAPPEAGGQIARAFHEFLERLLKIIMEDRPRSLRRATEATEQGLIGGLAALIVDRVRSGDGASLPDLLPDLTELVLTPYVGRERAVDVSRTPRSGM